jgi:hypothetical protein
LLEASPASFRDARSASPNPETVLDSGFARFARAPE